MVIQHKISKGLTRLHVLVTLLKCQLTRGKKMENKAKGNSFNWRRVGLLSLARPINVFTSTPHVLGTLI